jgi:hypothetical protein
MADTDYKLEAPEHDPQGTPAATLGPPVQTVAFTVTSPDTKTEKVEVELQGGDTLADKRLIVALVGLNHTGGSVNPNEIVLDVAAVDVASVSVTASKEGS